MSKPGPAFPSSASIPAVMTRDTVTMSQCCLSCLCCKVPAPGSVLLAKIHSSTLQLLLTLGASSPLGEITSCQSVCVFYSVLRAFNSGLQGALSATCPTLLQQQGEGLSPSTEGFPVAGCAVSSSSVCHAEGRMDTASHRNMLQPHSRPGSDLCAGPESRTSQEAEREC